MFTIEFLAMLFRRAWLQYSEAELGGRGWADMKLVEPDWAVFQAPMA